jgi:hypothetical protein
MGLPNIYITVNRSGLGQIAFTEDGIMGLLLYGKTVSGAGMVEKEKAYAVYSLSDAEKMGIAETGDNAQAWKQIKEFYDEAGSGAKLWFILSEHDLMNKTVTGTTNVARTLIEAANGEISLIGICRGDNTNITVENGLSDEVWDTMEEAQKLANEYQAMIMPFSVVIDGIGFTGNENAIQDLTTMNHHRCSVILAASDSDTVASVGQFMGRLSSISVQRKASRIKNGALTNQSGYLTDGVAVKQRMNAMGTLHDKGYIVYRTLYGKTGYFYSGDKTATSPTDDLNIIPRNRIIDKVLKIAYKVYSEELDDDVPVDEQGNIQPAVCAYLQQKMEQQVTGNMTGEISSFSAFIDPNQNILSGLPVEVVLSIVPKGYLGTINVTIGFSNPFNN